MADQLWFNPGCSKCRMASSLLDEAGVDAVLMRYLDQPPTVEQLRELMRMLGIDPTAMMRTGEERYGALGLSGASADAQLEAIAANPMLLERPIFVRNGRAVIARPPERVRELL